MGLINIRLSAHFCGQHKKNLWALALVLLLSGCNNFKACVATGFMQDMIADGVARLSVQQISMITKELKPLFDGEKATQTIEKIDGDDSGRGEVTWSVKNLIIDYPHEREVHKDCLGAKLFWQGKVEIISASMTMRGRLTNNKKNPVAPDDGRVLIKVHAKVHNLAVRAKELPGYLVMEEGEVKFNVLPRLAESRVGETKGFLAAPTAYTRFEKVKLMNIKGLLVTNQATIPITIENSLLNYQVGEGEKESNKISGQITLLGNQRNIPTDGQGLDPDYNKEQFIKTFKCEKELDNQDPRFQVASVEKQISSAMAGLTTLVMGAIAKKLEDDETCGMASSKGLSSTKFEGDAGAMGKVSAEIKECEIEFSESEPAIGADCFGVLFYLSGKAKVISAKKSIKGLITTDRENFLEQAEKFNRNAINDKPQAVIPSKKQPVKYEIVADLHDLTLKEDCSNVFGNTENAHHCTKRPSGTAARFDEFKIHSGTVDAVLEPILAKQLDKRQKTVGFCAAEVPLSEAYFTLIDFSATIKALGNQIYLPLNGAFSLVSGKVGTRENEISGQIFVGKKPINFTVNGVNSKLDPDYVSTIYEQSYSCQSVQVPETDDDCNAWNGLAVNVARALVPAAGALLEGLAPKLEFNNMGNIYSSFWQAKDLWKTKIEKDKDGQEIMRLKISKDNHQLKYEGNSLSAAGEVSAVMKIEQKGIPISYTEKAKFMSAVGPTSHFSTTITANGKVTDFEISALGSPLIGIETNEFIRVVAKPYMDKHKDKSTSGHDIYNGKTEIIEFEKLKFGPSSLVLKTEGFHLPIEIKSAHLKAMVGQVPEETSNGNSISGTIVFDFKGREFPVEIPEQDLIPPFMPPAH